MKLCGCGNYEKIAISFTVHYSRMLKTINHEIYQLFFFGKQLLGLYIWVCWIISVWKLRISVALSSCWAPAPPPPPLPAAPLVCPSSQSPACPGQFCWAACPSGTLCCRNAHIPPLFLQQTQKGSDTTGPSASLQGADAASTPCNGCWGGEGEELLITVKKKF